MSEIKVGSKVRSLYRTGQFAGLEGIVTKIEKPWKDVELPEGFVYMGSTFPIIHFGVDGRIYSGEGYTLECLDPEEVEEDVLPVIWAPLAHKDVFGHRWPIRVLTLDGHLITEGWTGNANKTGDTLTSVEIKSRWTGEYFHFNTRDLAEVRFERKVDTGA